MKDISKKQIMVRNPNLKDSFNETLKKFSRGHRLLLVIPRKNKPDRIKNLYNKSK